MNVAPQADRPRKARSFVLTWNNYPPQYLDRFQSCGSKYYCIGEEIAPTTGTPHLQCFVQYTNSKSFDVVRRHFIGCSVQIARGKFCLT